MCIAESRVSVCAIVMSLDSGERHCKTLALSFLRGIVRANVVSLLLFSLSGHLET